MAKNTLSFEEQKPTGSVDIGTTPVSTPDTLWYGDEVTLYDGDTITITSFEGIDEVRLLGGASAIVLNAVSPSYEHESTSATLKIALKNEDKGKVVHYEIERATVGAGYSSNPEPNEVEDADGETTYKADTTSYATHIQLAAGDTIKSVNVPSPGGSPLLYFVGDTPRYHTIIENWADGFTSDVDEEIIIVFFSHYEESTGAYKIINKGASESDTFVSGTEIYTNDADSIALKSGDTITNTSDTAKMVIMDLNGNILATIDNDESYTTTDDITVLFGSDDDDVTLEYEVAESAPKYTVEYTGGSGILQLTRKEGGKLRFFADAGGGYMQVFETKAKEVMYYINMTCLDGIKIESETEVISATVNEE